MPEISVIIPAHNSIKYLPRTVDSVLSQTYGDFELVIVDNGSTDGTGEWVNGLKDSRIRYHYQENTGCPAGSRNSGIRLASCEIIAFIDADDIWEKNKLEKQIRLFENPAIGLACTGLKFIDGDGKPSGAPDLRFFRGNVSEKLILNNFITGSSVMLRKSILEKNNFNFRSGRKGTEDWDLWLRMSLVTEFDFIDEPLLSYRKYPESISRNGELMYQSHKTTVAAFREFVREKNPANRDRLLELSKRADGVAEFCYSYWLFRSGRKKEALKHLFLSFGNDFLVIRHYFLIKK